MSIPKPEDLLCEYATNPKGLDVKKPRFSWKLRHRERGKSQNAYRILVASDKSKLEPGEADMWDTGKVESSKSINVRYDGESLESFRKYYWKVRWWDDKDNKSPLSDTGSFLMGILDPDDWEAEWIGNPNEDPGYAHIFRKEFNVDREIDRAQVHVSGIGYHELRINGEKAGDRVLDPGHTEYVKRTLYSTHEVTELLEKGSNALGVMVGNGWHGKPEMILQLEIFFSDGERKTITSDQSWQVSSGPITRNSIYDGEVYDARLKKPGWDEPNEEKKADREVLRDEWTRAVRLEGPGGRLESQKVEPIRVTEVIYPDEVTNPDNDIYVFDLGRNITGWAEIEISGERGSEISMRYGEVLGEDGRVNQKNLRSADVEDRYILSGRGTEKYEPRFTYHGFRYVEVEGLSERPSEENLKGKFVRSSVEEISDFETSDTLLNQIQDNVVRGTKGNLHSIPTDCPQRDERMGWLGDNTVYAEEAIYNLDMVRFYSKWLKDIADAQDDETGAVPDTAPFRWGQIPSDPGWGSCYVLLPWFLYLYYGDERVLEEHYEGMKKWVDFLSTSAEDGLVKYSYYGDWCAPEDSCVPSDGSPPKDSPEAVVEAGSYPKNTPGIQISTWWYYYSALLLSKIAGVLGRDGDLEKYRDRAEEIKGRFNERFLDEEKGEYASGSQTSNSLPLFLDMVPDGLDEEILENIISDIMEERDGHLNTGIVGTKYLLQTLSKHDEDEVAYTVASQRSYPSWGYMIEKGATTIWERWELKTGGGMNSHNHPMLGTISEWFHKYLAGIKPDPSDPGFKKINIEPRVVEDLDFVEDSIESVKGTISSKWERSPDSLKLRITIPVNCEAEVKIPNKKDENTKILEGEDVIWEDGIVAELPQGVLSGKTVDGRISLKLGSGDYHFEIKAN